MSEIVLHQAQVRRGRLAVWDTLILLAASAVGVMAFLYPFFTLSVEQQTHGLAASAHSQDAPLVLLLLVTLCLGAILANLQSGRMNSKMVAVLGVLVAMNAVLRAVPGPAGFSLVFILPILCGYAFGGTFGFLLGALSLLVSAFIGGGVGPWLPYQMFTAGWVGLLSAWLPDMRRLGRWEGLVLAVWGFLLGLIFGAIMNIWFWPFIMAPAGSDMYWSAGLSLIETLQRYAVFYAVTSLWWDLWRAAGNLALILLFGAPILKVLRRFQARFNFLALPAEAQ
jgi:energy-coupling factor transport system substrate-specific component